MSYQSIEGEKNLVRDKESGAIINVNSRQIEAAKKAKIAALKRKEELNSMQSDIDSLKDDMSEIKSVLNKIVEKL